MKQSEVDEAADKLMPGWTKRRDEANKITVERLQNLIDHMGVCIKEMELDVCEREMEKYDDTTG